MPTRREAIAAALVATGVYAFDRLLNPNKKAQAVSLNPTNLPPTSTLVPEPSAQSKEKDTLSEVPFFSQYSPRASADIKRRGCGPISLAMILAYWKKIPATEAAAWQIFDEAVRKDLMGPKGTEVHLMAKLAKDYDLQVLASGGRSFSQLVAEIKRGQPILTAGRTDAKLTGVPHIWVAVEIDEKRQIIIIHDPATNPPEKGAYREYSYKEFRAVYEDQGGWYAVFQKFSPEILKSLITAEEKIVKTERFVSLVSPGAEWEMLGTHSSYIGARDILFNKNDQPVDNVLLRAIGNGQVLWVEEKDTWSPKNDKVETRGGKFIDIIVKDEKGRLVLVHMSHLNDFATVGGRPIQAGNIFRAGDVLAYSGHSGNASKYIGTKNEKYGRQVHIGFQLVQNLPADIQGKIKAAILNNTAYRVPSTYAPGGNHNPGEFLNNILQGKEGNLSRVFD